MRICRLGGQMELKNSASQGHHTPYWIVAMRLSFITFAHFTTSAAMKS